MSDTPTDPEKQLRAQLMTVALDLLSKVKKLDEAVGDDDEREKILNNLKPQMDVFASVSKWYGVATKASSEDTGEGAAFDGFRKNTEGRGRAGSDPGGNGSVPNRSGRNTDQARAIARRALRAASPRDIITKPQ